MSAAATANCAQTVQRRDLFQLLQRSSLSGRYAPIIRGQDIYSDLISFSQLLTAAYDANVIT